MGSTISYYMSSRSIQDMEDYINTYDSVVYAQHHDLLNNENTKDDNHDNDDNDDDSLDCYKLYIYIYNDFDNHEKIKHLYKTNASKHNEIVEKYLNSSFSKSDFEYCYDSGFDLYCPLDISCEKSIYLLDHKISCAMTYKGKFVGYYLYMRSSTPIKTPLRMANNVGIIDSGYRGNIKACFDIVASKKYENDNEVLFNFQKENRYVQLCPPDIGKPMKVSIVDSISMLGKKNNRGLGGFGSTGN